MQAALPLIERGASAGVTVGYFGIDTQRSARAVAVALCSDAQPGLIGSLGHYRGNYFRVMQHVFYDDRPGSLLEDLANGTAAGSLPYCDTIQWSESDSPLRLDFRTEDPLRNGWSLALASKDIDGPWIVRGGSLPPAGTSVSVPVGWQSACALFHRALEGGVDVYFDDEMQLMVSGYGLFAAGVIDHCLDVLQAGRPHSLEQGEVELSEEQARAKFMCLYAVMLSSFLALEPANTRAYDIAADHLQGVAKWLNENNVHMAFDAADAA
jgi:hypothetical protein